MTTPSTDLLTAPGQGELIDNSTLYRERVAFLRLAAEDEKFRALAFKIAARDPVWFANHFCWGYDPRSFPYINPVKLWKKQEVILKAFVDADGETSHTARGVPHPLLVEKGRDAGGSLLIAIASLWAFLFDKGHDVGLITRIGADLDDRTTNSLFGKIDFLISFLPTWLRPRYRRARAPKPTLVNLINGNVIQGTSTTAGAFRGSRFRRVYVDEAAHIQDLNAILDALSETTPSPALVSSVKGRGNAFAQIAHAVDGYSCVDYGTGEPSDDGAYRKLWIDYNDDPRKGEDWERETRRRLLPEVFSQEHDRNYDISVPHRIFPEWNDNMIYDADGWRYFVDNYLHRAKIIEAWDFGTGSSLTAVVWAAVYANHLYLLDYACWSAQPHSKVISDIAAKGWYTKENPNGVRPWKRIGDNSGKQRESTQYHWFHYFAKQGVHLTGRTVFNPEHVWQVGRQAMREEKIYGSPLIKSRFEPNLPTLHTSLTQFKRKTQSGRELDADPRQQKKKGDKYSHLADCFVFMLNEVYVLNPIQTLQASIRRPA